MTEFEASGRHLLMLITGLAFIGAAAGVTMGFVLWFVQCVLGVNIYKE